MPYGTTVDPNFYQEKAANAGRLIQQLLAQQEARKERRDRSEQEQLNFFFQTAEKDPSLANSMGPQLVEKYGKKYPVLEALVTGLQERQKLTGSMDTATKAYTDKLDSLQGNYQQLQQHAASLPDTMPFHVQVPTLQGMAPTDSPSPWLNDQARDANSAFADTASQLSPGLTLPIPNPEKAKVQATLAQANPMMFPVSAMYALPAEQQALVHLNPAIKHILPPQMPDLHDLPEKQRAIVLGNMGVISPESLEVAKMDIGITPKPADLQKQGAAYDLQDERLSREHDSAEEQRAFTDKHSTQNFENQKTLENLKDTHSKQRIAQNIGGQASLEDRKVAGQLKVLDVKQGYLQQKDDGTIPWKSVSTSSSQELSDWRKERSAFLSEQGKVKASPDEFAAADAKWQAANPRPVRVTDTASRYIVNKVNQAIKEDPSRADKALIVTQGQVQRYQSLMRQPGMTEEKALQLLFTKAPKPGDRDMRKLGSDLSAAGAPAGINSLPNRPGLQLGGAVDEPEATDNGTEEQEE